MGTNFPTSLDTLTNPSAGNPTTSPSHAAQHADANDAIEALEAKVGINNSAVTTSLDYRMGLQFITSVAVGTGVTSVNVTSCFTSTYENYRVIYTGGTGSTTALLAVQFLVGTTATATNYNGGAGWINVGAGVWQIGTDNNATQWNYAGGASSSYVFACFDVLQPQIARQTYCYGGFQQLDNGRVGVNFVHQTSATQFDGIRLAIGAGTMTGGTIRVYGYKN